MDVCITEERPALTRLGPESPVLAVLATRDRLWAGGAGAIAHRTLDDDVWVPCPPIPTLRMVLALAESGSSLFAAGAGGVVRSADRGQTWMHGRGTEQHTVLCLATSPGYHEDETILAGTATSGVLRSADGGASWSESRFGLHTDEVSDLIWFEDHSVLANGADGVYHSTNGGRSWRQLGQRSFALIRRTAKGLLAIDQPGGLWKSSDGDEWSRAGALPDGVEPQALVMAPTGEILVGTVKHGVLASRDGVTWTTSNQECVLSFHGGEHVVLAGTDSGVMSFDSARQAWRHLGSPRLTDHHQLLARPDGLFVSGVLAPAQRWTETDGWHQLDSCPVPLSVLTTGWDGQLLALAGDGLHVSVDAGETWRLRSTLPGGDFLTVRSDGAGWVASADGSTLCVTHDRGHTWEPLRSPFGVFRVVALQAAPDTEDTLVLAVTFDARQQSTTLWRSSDDGLTWQRGREAPTSWPEVSTLANPLAVSVGDAIILRGPDGVWMRTHPDLGSQVRQVAASKAGVVARTHDRVRLLRASDEHWRAVPDLPDQVISVALDGETLFVLGIGGELVARAVVPRQPEPLDEQG